MAQECGFFNAQLVGEDEYDRVYLAEQFAAYFASFIGNGVFGKSMQKLEVLAQASPDMSIKVLSGEAWINGWWYRNTEEYTLTLDVADGVLNRIDAIVLRWGNQERAMWLQVIKGTPSFNPVVPNIKRDADYYDLQLATVAISKGILKITQSSISDTRLNTNVCGLVTGVVDQIDTTDLYNQFEQYFAEFKATYEKDYTDWTAEQKEAYMNYIQEAQDAYDDWIQQKQSEYNTWIADKMAEYVEWVAASKQDYEDWTDEQKSEYLAWIAEQQLDFKDWYDTHTQAWTTEFYYWFNNIKKQLSGDIAYQLQEAIDELNEKVDGYIDRTTTFSDDDKTITQVSAEQTIVTTFVDPMHITQDYYVNNVKIKTESITFSADGKVITEAKEVI